MKSTRVPFFLAYLAVMMFSLSVGFASDGVIARIDSLTPRSGRPDDIITLAGAFGKHKVDGGGYKSVMAYKGEERKGNFNVVSWSANEVKVKVPYGLAAGNYDLVIVYNQFRSNRMRVSLRRPPYPNLSLDGVTIGFGKQKRTCGDQIILKPEEVRWLPDGRIDFDMVYGYKENNGVNAAGFENAMLWISSKDFSKGKKPRVVHSLQNLVIEGFGYKTVETHLTIPGPEMGTLYLDVNRDRKQPESGIQFRRCSFGIRFAGFDRPDLTIAKLAKVTKNPKVGERIKFEITVKNNGNEASPPTVAGVTVGGSTRVFTVPIPSIAPGKSVSKTFLIAALNTAQNYRLNAKIDHAGQVRESVEENNERYVDFNVRK